MQRAKESEACTHLCQKGRMSKTKRVLASFEFMKAARADTLAKDFEANFKMMLYAWSMQMANLGILVTISASSLC